MAGPDAAVASFDLPTVLRFADLALEALGAAREEIDALNVYPVPDRDTGTNLFLTFESARNAMLDALGSDATRGDLRIAFGAFARGAFLGARGSSGVIFSQLVGALCKRLAAAGPWDRSAVVLAEGMALATEASYAALGDPVEGTILTVARAASDAAGRAAADPGNRVGHVVRAASRAAREALVGTPGQLPALRDAGVVDAGGRGLCVVLDAADTALTGRRPVSRHTPLGSHAIPVPLTVGDLTPGGPAYEVTYLLDAESDRVPALRSALGELGDSLVVVGDDGHWNVHVHVDDVGAALEAGVQAGRPHRVRVTHFADQVRRPSRTDETRPRETRPGRTVVAVAAGAGLGELFEQAGATVVRGEPGRRPSTAQVIEAVQAAGTAEVIVLPNDRDSIAAAEAAARAVRQSRGARVAVIPTDAQVQGLAALAVHEPGRSFEEDIVDMSAAARHARSGSVTVAAKRAMTSAGPCEPGDVLGAIEGDYVLVGHDLREVANGVVERMLGGGGELVTLVAGAHAEDLADSCASYVQANHPTVDVVVYLGGQQGHPLLVGVE